jgi:hypothetical protein
MAAEQVTHVKGELLVHNPTAATLEMLLARLILDPAEFPPATIARLIMERLTEPASLQFGPGLEAVTGGQEGGTTVWLKWEFWV